MDTKTMPPPIEGSDGAAEPPAAATEPKTMPLPIDATAVYTRAQVARLFCVTPKQIGVWETTSQIPPGYTQGGRRCWLGSTLLNDQRAKQQKALTEAGLSPHAA